MDLEIVAIVNALLAAGWVCSTRDGWAHEDASGLTFGEAVIHDLEIAAKWRRGPTPKPELKPDRPNWFQNRAR